jgi:hypothetical protein
MPIARVGSWAQYHFISTLGWLNGLARRGLGLGTPGGSNRILSRPKGSCPNFLISDSVLGLALQILARFMERPMAAPAESRGERPADWSVPAIYAVGT